MKNLLWIVLLFCPLDSFSQNFKRILHPVELDSISKGYKIFKTIDKKLAKEFDGLEAKIIIYKADNKIWFDFLDKAQKFDDERNLIAELDVDSIRLMKTYKEFNTNGETVYDCVYRYKEINGCLYRLEHQKLYYQPNVLKYEGYRYRKIRDEAGKFTRNTPQRRYGKCTYYLPDGEIEKIKDYGSLEKVLPPTSALDGQQPTKRSRRTQ